MPWVTRRQPSVPYHPKCELPLLMIWFRTGSLYACDICGKQYEITRVSKRGQRFWKPVS